MDAKFYEIQSLLFQDIEKSKTSWMNGQMDGQHENSILHPTNTVCRRYRQESLEFKKKLIEKNNRLSTFALRLVFLS